MKEDKLVKSKKKLVVLLLVYLAIAFGFIGSSLFMIFSHKKEGTFVSDRELALYKILVLIGVFFLVLAFGYIVPAIIKASKGEYGIFDERDMMQALEKYLPNGETLTGGIYTIGMQMEIKETFEKCAYIGDKLIPDENGTTLQVIKSKFSSFYIYVGISQHYLIFSECEPYEHFYKFNDVSNLEETVVEKISTDISLEDLGTCFPLAEIQSCVFKNARNGAVKCSITMKNGSYFKLKFPKQGGPGMPHHAEYREAIIACLSDNKVLKGGR